MKKLLIIALGLFMTNISFAQTIDTEKSVVTFSVSNTFFNTVKGTVKGMKGKVTIEPENISSASFETTVDVSTIDTDNNKRDEHLKNADFFEVETYPVMKIKSQKVVETDSGNTLIAELTIKDVTKKVEIPFTFSEKKGQYYLEGKFVINRYEYNVGTDTGTTMVGEDITVKIKCVLNK